MAAGSDVPALPVRSITSFFIRLFALASRKSETVRRTYRTSPGCSGARPLREAAPPPSSVPKFNISRTATSL